MKMRKTFLSFLIFPLVVSNQSSADVFTRIKNIVSGQNASVKTEVTNVVNQNVTHIESDGSGEIKVEVKNGEVKIESSPEVLPTVVISELSEEEVEEVKEEITEKIENIKNQVFSFFTRIFSDIPWLFRFRP